MKIMFSEKVHKRWKDELNQYGILYLYAMSGFGKTVQAIEFAKQEYKEWIRIEVTDSLLEDLDQFIVQKKTGKVKKLLIIDDLQWLQQEEMRQNFLEKILWVLKNQRNVNCMLLSRARLPEYLTVLKLTNQLVIEDSESLVLSQEMVAEMVENSGLVDKRGDLFREANLIQNDAFEKCMDVSKGYAIALNAYIERLKEPHTDSQTAYQLGLVDVFTYFDHHVYQVWDLRHREAMMHLSVCEFFDMELAHVLLGAESEEIINNMYQIGSFIREDSNHIMRIHPIFLAFLRKKLSQIPESERNTLYERAGTYYESHRYVVQALECYKQAGIYDRLLNLICYLSENADGCEFAKCCYQYMEELPKEYEERFPKLLAVKVMVYSYHMEIDKSNYYLDKLKQKAEEEKNSKVGKEALTNYVRTLIALPHGTTEKTLENLRFFPEFVKKNGLKIRNVIATGNMPSMINGGLDLILWGENYKVLYPLMKFSTETIIGKEAIGIAEVSVGEHLYEVNQMAKAIAFLTRGLSEANLRGSIRVQYAATAVMAKVFQADNQWDTAYEIMNNILKRAKQISFLELVPNIEASILQLELLKGESGRAEKWLETSLVDEHQDFFITVRYRLWMKANVYVALDRNIEALYIIELLEKYATLFQRTYFMIQLRILRAIIYNRIGTPWKQELLEAVKVSEKYKYVRVLADQGAALLPLWKEWITDTEVKKQFNEKYLATVLKELKNMAVHYPKYLKPQKKIATVTKKEIEVLRLMADGLNNQEIAKALNLSIATVKFHVSNILKKLQVDNRTSAVLLAEQEGLL